MPYIDGPRFYYPHTYDNQDEQKRPPDSMGIPQRELEKVYEYYCNVHIQKTFWLTSLSDTRTEPNERPFAYRISDGEHINLYFGDLRIQSFADNGNLALPVCWDADHRDMLHLTKNPEDMMRGIWWEKNLCYNKPSLDEAIADVEKKYNVRILKAN